MSNSLLPSSTHGSSHSSGYEHRRNETPSTQNRKAESSFPTHDGPHGDAYARVSIIYVMWRSSYKSGVYT